MKLVNQTDALSLRFGDEAAVRILCESGFDGIDYSMFRMKNNSDDILNSAGYKEYVLELRRIADCYGVTFEQAHAPFPSAVDGDEDYNADIFEKLKRAIEISGLLGSEICVVHPAIFAENQFEKNMELYRALEPTAESFGVKIALENMWIRKDINGVDKICRVVCSDAEDFNRYVDTLGTNNFTACLDLGHCGLVGEDAADMIRAMGSGRIGALHIHDNEFLHDCHTLPYTMEMDWDSILTALGEIDYKGNFTYEADHFLNGFPDELMGACERFMHDVGRSMMKRIEKSRLNK
ncbi:MAG: sugar phosphate isomerase/epimerase [Clostridiaceae bacterium]|nr:sugar phosphate isomerase/epimerase [Clostridiaceae bacterium]